MTEHCYKQKYLKSTCLLSMGWMEIFFNDFRRFIFYRKYCSQICLCSEWFSNSDVSVFIQLVVTIWRGWRWWRRIIFIVKLLSILFSDSVSSADSIGYGWRAMIYCCRFWNDEILLKFFEIVRLKNYVEYFNRYQNLFLRFNPYYLW